MNVSEKATRIASIGIVGIALAAGGYVSCRHFAAIRSGQAEEHMHVERMFRHANAILDTIGLTLSNTPLDSWERVYSSCKRSFNVVSHPDAPNPFPISFTDQCRFGRVKALPHGLSPERTPLIWNLMEFPSGFALGNKCDPVEGRTSVVFWSGDLRYMPLSDIENRLAVLVAEHPEISLVVLDRWEENGAPLWRELK